MLVLMKNMEIHTQPFQPPLIISIESILLRITKINFNLK